MLKSNGKRSRAETSSKITADFHLSSEGGKNHGRGDVA